MKIALLGTGFGQAHAAVYAQRPDVDEVVVFGRTPDKLATISGQFGFATTTDLDGLIADLSVDLVDICLPSTWPPACSAARTPSTSREPAALAAAAPPPRSSSPTRTRPPSAAARR
jgi:hypothetical protein